MFPHQDLLGCFCSRDPLFLRHQRRAMLVPCPFPGGVLGSNSVPCTLLEDSPASRSTSLPKHHSRLSLVLGKPFGSHVTKSWPRAFFAGCRTHLALPAWALITVVRVYHHLLNPALDELVVLPQVTLFAAVAAGKNSLCTQTSLKAGSCVRHLQ